MLPTIFLHIVIFCYGIIIGSFLNVLIYRVPKKENIAIVRSHCMQCGYQLAWYDLIPLFSWLALRGKCRKCGEKISVQYPLIEALNGVLYIMVFHHYGLSIESLLYCLLFSALLTLSVIDFRTYEIPVGFNYFILALGLIRLATDLNNWKTYVIGFLAVSVFLISNTVAIGISVRSEEINIMKYVGATDFFVRSPFVLEGMLIGLVGAGIPLFFIYGLYNTVLTYALERFTMLSSLLDFLPVEEIFRYLTPLSLAVGVGIGFLGSIVTVRKHLHV